MNVAVDYVANILLIFHNERAPTDADWQIYVDAILNHSQTARAQIVLSLGGSPNAKQRSQATRAGKDALGDKPVPPTAVMSASSIVRSMVTLFNWMFPARYKAFHDTDFARVCDWLGLSAAEREEVEAAFVRLRAQCGA